MVVIKNTKYKENVYNIWPEGKRAQEMPKDTYNWRQAYGCKDRSYLNISYASNEDTCQFEGINWDSPFKDTFHFWKPDHWLKVFEELIRFYILKQHALVVRGAIDAGDPNPKVKKPLEDEKKSLYYHYPDNAPAIPRYITHGEDLRYDKLSLRETNRRFTSEIRELWNVFENFSEDSAVVWVDILKNWEVKPTFNLFLIEYFILVLSFSFFFFGLYGMIYNLWDILIFICFLELCVASSVMNFILASTWYLQNDAQMFSLIILVLAAVESSFGLSIAILLHKLK